MIGRARLALTAGVVALGLLVMGAGFPAETVSPEQYAAGTCTVLNEWQATVLRSGLASASVMTRSPALSRIRRSMAHYIGDMATASGRAARDLQALGAPAMPKGRTIARALVRLFADTHTSMAELGARARTLRSRAALDRLDRDWNRSLDRVNTASRRLERLDPDARLEAAAAHSDACRAEDLKAADETADTARSDPQEESR